MITEKLVVAMAGMGGSNIGGGWALIAGAIITLIIFIVKLCKKKK